MYSEARKLHLIERVLKVKKESILIAIENVLKEDEEITNVRNHTIYDFMNMFSNKESKIVKDAIAESCETIDENDWK